MTLESLKIIFNFLIEHSNVNFTAIAMHDLIYLVLQD